MKDTRKLFAGVKTVLVIDWPSKEVPETLALAGFEVIVRGGPGPQDYSAYELEGGQVVVRKTVQPPERAELVYSFRPLNELPGIVSTAKRLHARTIWTQSGISAEGKRDAKGCWLAQDELQRARDLINSAGLNHVSEPYIAEYARELSARQ